MPIRRREKWTTRQAAAHCGLEPAVFRNYGLRNGAPTPLPDERAGDGQRLYWADEVQRWQAGRRGPGRRRDTP